MTIVDIQRSLTLATVNNGKCLFQYRNEELTLKTLCAIVGQFNASLNVTTEKMSGGDIYECAVMLAEYTHDRIEDFILCLKMAKRGDFGKIYNRVDTLVIIEFWQKYLEEKAKFMESDYLSAKSKTGHYRNELDSVIISAERKQESEKEKTQRLINAQKQEIRSLKDTIKQEFKTEV